MASIHLGELLVRNHVMTPEQRDAVLEAQRARGGPFGVLAEEMFGISPQAVEAAWAEQYAAIAPRVDPRGIEVHPRVLELINRRQAWQFCMLPLTFDAEDLVACTTQEHLVRALKFAGWRLGQSCRFVLADAAHLGEALCRHYPMAGMCPNIVTNRSIMTVR